MKQFQILVLLALLTNAAWGQSFDTPQAYYEDASQLHAAGDDDAAAIQLRNALQLYNDHVPSLVLLGTIQLEQRVAGEAMQMLEEALLLGADPNIVLFPLSQAYLQLGEYSRLLTQIPLDAAPDAQLTKLLAAHAQAKISLGKLADAETLIERGLERDSALLDLKLAQFTLLLRQGRFEESNALSQALVAQFPDDGRAWNAAGSIADLTGDKPRAIELYEKSLETEPFNADARIALISDYLDSGSKTDARRHIQWMREEIPSDPRAAYFEALLASMDGDQTAESAALSDAAEIFDALAEERLATDPQVQMIGALTYFGLGAFEKARDLVSRYIANHPEDASAGRLLASTLVALGEAEEAVQVLQPYHRRSPQDWDTTLVLATAMDKAGRSLDAARLLERIPGIGSGTHPADKSYAQILSNAGDTRRGAALLERVFSTAEQTSENRLQLATAYLLDKQWAPALEILEELTTAYPEDPQYQNLIGVAYKGAGRTAEAALAFSEITQSHPEFIAGWSNLASLRRDEGDLETARSLLEKANQVDPDEPRVYFELAQLSLRENNLADALRNAERAVLAQPGNYAFTELEVELHFMLGDSGSALDAALRAATREGAPPVMQRLLSVTQARSGDTEQALITLKRASRSANFSASELTAIAELQMRYDDYASAAASIDSALKGDAEYLPARRARVQVEIGLGNAATALTLAQGLVDAEADDAINQLQLAEARMFAGRAAEALLAFERAESLGAGDLAIIGQIDALQALGRQDAAITRLAAYVKNGGNHPELRGRYADSLMAAGEWLAARKVLEDLHKDYATPATILNNLANVLFELDDAGAIPTAKKALALDKGNAAINDTLGWLLLQSGDPQAALGYLREATTRASRNPELRYHLAEGLAALGRRAEALQEVETSLSLSESFSARAAAVALRERLIGSE